MIITCKECKSKFTLDEKLIKDQGSKVQCSNCSHLFTVYPQTSDAPTIQLTDMLGGEGANEPGGLNPEDEGKQVAQAFQDAASSLDEPQFDLEGHEGTKPPGDDDDLDLSTILEADKDLSIEIDDDGFDLDLSLENGLEKSADASENRLGPDLEFESISDTESFSEKPFDDADIEEIQDFDLSDLEELVELDQGPNAMAPGEKEPEETSQPMEIDLGMEGPLEAAETAVELDLKLESEEDTEIISDIKPDDGADPLDKTIDPVLEKPVSEEESEELELDLDFELDDEEPAQIVEADTPSEEAASVTTEKETDLGPEVAFEQIPITAVPPAPARTAEAPGFSLDTKSKPIRKKPISTPLLVVLIIALLGGAGYGGFLLLDRMGMEVPYIDKIAPYIDKIPYINEFREPRIQDPGNLKMTPFKIESKFVRTEKNGKRFVITGQIRNDYPEPRSFISVNGKLFLKGKKKVKSKTIYSGNPLADEEIARLSMADIGKRLSIRAGKNGINTKIKPGQHVPFIIVFEKLPDNLDEFTVEVVTSSPAK